MDYSDEEKHALELRRERSHKISKLMGEYLLKGYKMLASTCNKCGTILMRDRKQNDYCVSCNDIDGIMVGNSVPQGVQETGMHVSEPEVRNTARNDQTAGVGLARDGAISKTDEYKSVMKEVEIAILMKMRWACFQLQSDNLEGSFRTLEFINVCHEMLAKLNPSQ